MASQSSTPDRQPVDWRATDVDTDRPNAARMYDYLLGGGHNFAADREAAETVMRHIPAEYFARTNRAFLGRAIRYLVGEQGVRQFLDLGSGIPTVGNVHEIAQHEAPDCRVMYVDNDPVAVAHAETILSDNPHAAVIYADLREPNMVVDLASEYGLIDFQEPVAVLLCAVLHFVPDDDDPSRIIAAYRGALTPGSYLAISHATDDDYPAELARAVDVYKDTSTPATLRTRDEILRLFDGFTVVDPGLVFTPLWRPDSSDDGEDPRRSLCYGGVGAL